MSRSVRSSRRRAREQAARAVRNAPSVDGPEAGVQTFNGSPVGAGIILSGGLNAKVLVLNKLYMAMRVVNAKRAFSLLVCDHAEVVHVDNGQYLSYDFEGWSEISELQREFEPDQHDWVRTVRLEIAVPKVIRLLGYDRLPQQLVEAGLDHHSRR